MKEYMYIERKSSSGWSLTFHFVIVFIYCSSPHGAILIYFILRVFFFRGKYTDIVKFTVIFVGILALEILREL